MASKMPMSQKRTVILPLEWGGRVAGEVHQYCRRLAFGSGGGGVIANLFYLCLCDAWSI